MATGVWWEAGGVRWRAWIGKGALALGDQGLISGSNFAISILLARWFAPGVYGAYALAFAAFLLASQLHQALLLEPMSVFGGARHRGRLRHYLGGLLWLHAGAALLISLLLGVASAGALFVRHSPSLAWALAGVAVASPAILLFWLLRRAFYLDLRPAQATRGAVLYCVLTLGLLFAAYRMKLLAPASAFVVMGMAALATSAWFALSLRPEWRRAGNPLPLRVLSDEHWNYGRWALASAVAMWVPGNLYYLLLGATAIEQAGQLRALMNLALPVGQTATALSLLFVPYAARANAEGGAASLRRVGAAITALFALGAASYWVILLLWRAPVLRLFYGHRYSEIGVWLPLLALSSILQTSINGPAIALRAGERPRAVFYAYLLASVITFAAGPIAARVMGVGGAVGVMAAANLAAFALSGWLLLRNGPGNAEAEAA